MTDSKHHAVSIFEAGLAAVDPKVAVQQALALRGDELSVRALPCSANTSSGCTVNLKLYQKVLLVGAGKASVAMASGVEDTVLAYCEQQGLPFSGYVITKYDHYPEDMKLRQTEVAEAAHPVADAKGVTATRALMQRVAAAQEDTLVLVVISGGGSALLTAPVEGVSLQDVQTVTTLLLGCGASIQEVNTVRKQISGVKGGKLAALAAPARLVCLVQSDVIGDPLDVIASGPTVVNPTTAKDAVQVLQKYQVLAQLPEAVRLHLTTAAQQQTEPTSLPHPPQKQQKQQQKEQQTGQQSSTFVICSNVAAIESCKTKAEALGYGVLILSTQLEGEAQYVGQMLASIAKEVLSSGNPIPSPCCIIAGGETTVTLGDSTGKGGRNQELVTSAARYIQESPDVVIFSAGTDGTDGPTDSAGGCVDHKTVATAEALGVDIEDYMQRHDCYHFLEHVDAHVKTGATGTNVMDIQLILVGTPS